MLDASHLTQKAAYETLTNRVVDDQSGKKIRYIVQLIKNKKFNEAVLLLVKASSEKMIKVRFSSTEKQILIENCKNIVKGQHLYLLEFLISNGIPAVEYSHVRYVCLFEAYKQGRMDMAQLFSQEGDLGVSNCFRVLSLIKDLSNPAYRPENVYAEIEGVLYGMSDICFEYIIYYGVEVDPNFINIMAALAKKSLHFQARLETCLVGMVEKYGYKYGYTLVKYLENNDFAALFSYKGNKLLETLMPIVNMTTPKKLENFLNFADKSGLQVDREALIEKFKNKSNFGEFMLVIARNHMHENPHDISYFHQLAQKKLIEGKDKNGIVLAAAKAIVSAASDKATIHEVDVSMKKGGDVFFETSKSFLQRFSMFGTNKKTVEKKCSPEEFSQFCQERMETISMPALGQ